MSLKMERLKIIDVLVDKLYCDNCGAEMQPYGMVYMTSPPQYPYMCPLCDNKTISTEGAYPIYYLELSDGTMLKI